MGAINQAKWRAYLAIGSGVGIEIGEDCLRVCVVKVRPGGVKVERAVEIASFRDKTPLDVGVEYQEIIEGAGASHVAATVVLPRRDVIVRVLAMPGVKDDDLAAAIGFQADALHPFEETEAMYGWSRLPGTTNVLIGIARRQVVESYHQMLVAAGIKVAGFTFSAAAFYGAIRILPSGRPASFVALATGGTDHEIYGESEARTIYSALISGPAQRAVAAAVAELRLDPETEARPLAELLPPPRPAPEGYSLAENELAYSAAIGSACPWLALGTNLLPEEWRAASSRMRYAPTLALSAVLGILLLILLFQKPWSDRQYLAKLNSEIIQLEPTVKHVTAVEANAARERGRILELDRFQKRTAEDLDLLNELSQKLPPPAWVSQMDLTRDAVMIAGEAGEAAGLLKLLDDSPRLEGAEFAMPISRSGNGEQFRIRARREGGGQ